MCVWLCVVPTQQATETMTEIQQLSLPGLGLQPQVGVNKIGFSSSVWQTEKCRENRSFTPPKTNVSPQKELFQ